MHTTPSFTTNVHSNSSSTQVFSGWPQLNGDVHVYVPLLGLSGDSGENCMCAARGGHCRLWGVCVCVSICCGGRWLVVWVWIEDPDISDKKTTIMITYYAYHWGTQNHSSTWYQDILVLMDSNHVKIDNFWFMNILRFKELFIELSRIFASSAERKS